MQLYFIEEDNAGCDPEGEQLVGKVNSHYGFDILTSEFKRVSLFDIKQKGCRTNMYDVERLSEGLASSVSSSARHITSFRDETKRSMESSLKISAEAEEVFGRINPINLGGSVAASFPAEAS